MRSKTSGFGIPSVDEEHAGHGQAARDVEREKALTRRRGDVGRLDLRFRSVDASGKDGGRAHAARAVTADDGRRTPAVVSAIPAATEPVSRYML